MKLIPGYQQLIVRPVPLTPEQELWARRNAEAHAVWRFYEECRDKSEAERDSIWHILTSRGAEKLIYGPRPDKR